MSDQINWGDYKVAKEGETSATKVSEIKKGLLGEFIPKESLKFADSAEDREERAKAPSIQVKTENGASKVLALPKSGTIHPKSALALWKKTYKEYPKVGQEVETEMDEQGFQRIILKTR